MPAAVSALPFARNNGAVVSDGRSGVRAPSRRLVNSSTSHARLRLARRRLWPQALVLHAARYHRAAGDDHGTARRLARAPASVAASAAGAPTPAYQDQQGGVVGGPTGQGVAEGGWGDSSSQRQAGRAQIGGLAFRVSMFRTGRARRLRQSTGRRPVGAVSLHALTSKCGLRSRAFYGSHAEEELEGDPITDDLPTSGVWRLACPVSTPTAPSSPGLAAWRWTALDSGQ